MINNRKMVKEEGVVVEKIFKAESEQFTAFDGKVIPAQPNRYILRVVSGDMNEDNEEYGMQSAIMLDYKVDKLIFDNATFLRKCKVKYEFGGNSPKAESLSLL